MKTTKQGVRDLSDIGSKKTVGRKLEAPPVKVMCNHKGHIKERLYWNECTKCGASFDVKW